VDYYLDQHIYDDLLELGTSNACLSAIIKAHGLRLILSEHHIQETLSCWKSGSPKKIEKGQRLIRLQLAVTPVRFLLPTPFLINHEIGCILGNSVRGPFLDARSEALTRKSLENVADGSLTTQQYATLTARWGSKQESVELYEDQRQEDIFKPLKRAESFEAFVKSNTNILKEFAEQIAYRHIKGLAPRERKIVAKMASLRLGKCRALRAAARADMYLSYRRISGHKIERSFWDDLCHSICATYATVFVTRDIQLRQRLVSINNHIRVQDFVTFKRELRL
jgi:hypothetical protein